MDWHPVLIAAVPALAGALIPQVRDAIVGWVRGWWDGRPRKLLRQLNARLTAHLDAEDDANRAMVVMSAEDQADRESRQDHTDAEFRAIDSRFERVEGRIDAAHAELGQKINDVGEKLAHLTGAVEVLIGQKR